MLLRCGNQTVLGRRSRSGVLAQLHAHRVVIVTGHQIQRVTVLHAVGGVPPLVARKKQRDDSSAEDDGPAAPPPMAPSWARLPRRFRIRSAGCAGSMDVCTQRTIIALLTLSGSQICVSLLMLNALL